MPFLGDSRPITVQLLGTANDFIAPTDNVDLSTGKGFHYIEIDGASHRGIVNLEADARQKFAVALTGNAKGLKHQSLAAEDVFDGCDEVDDFDAQILPKENSKVQHVVFVIHGIRDRGFWTRRIARKVKTVARERGELCRAVTSTYGFFPMGPFSCPGSGATRSNGCWTSMSQRKSLYPEASFSYIGHSNGTYLLAKALEICGAIRFDDVVFCGSMVRRNFEWARYIPSRVSRMINYVATDDWVVAIFPHGLERLRLQDVGGAGHLRLPRSRHRQYPLRRGRAQRRPGAGRVAGNGEFCARHRHRAAAADPGHLSGPRQPAAGAARSLPG